MKRSKLARYLAPLAAIAAGIATAAAAMLAPRDLIERAVEASHAPDWFPAAAPPLGAKARALLAFGLASLAAMAAFAASLLFDWKRRRQRRAARAPLSMVELGLLAPAEVEEIEPVAISEVEGVEPVATEVEEVESVAHALSPSTPPLPGNVTALVDRFEHGLARRRAARTVQPPEPANVDEALSDVLTELRRLAVQR